MARTQAREKALMNPSFTPVFFSTSSLYSFRNSIKDDMSTSLKVVETLPCSATALGARQCGGASGSS